MRAVSVALIGLITTAVRMVTLRPCDNGTDIFFLTDNLDAVSKM